MAIYHVTMTVQHTFVQETTVEVEVEAEDREDAYHIARGDEKVRDSREKWDASWEDTEVIESQVELLLGEEAEESVPRLPSKFLTKAPIAQLPASLAAGTA